MPNARNILQLVVRIVAAVTLVNLAIILLCENSSTHCRELANAPFGRMTILWCIITSSLLPPVVAVEAWMGRESKTAKSSIWIDAVLAIICFCLLWGIVIYAWGHYAVI